LRTNLVCGEAKFQMVEHLMAALVSLEIDNCIVEIDSEELPALDGSSLGYVQQLSKAGLIVQASPRRRLVIRDRYRVGTPRGWVEATPSHGGECYYEYQLSFDDGTPISPQAFSIELTPDRFIREVAPARTFVTSSQAEQIRASGLASHVTNQDLLVIGQAGPIDNDYRFSNECARHKTLDLIGDLALCGVQLVGRFRSFRGGHRLNGEVATRLAELAQQQSSSADGLAMSKTRGRKAG
jgi:UDP-3-O-acyl-N-acetylglucosamine deacetylase